MPLNSASERPVMGSLSSSAEMEARELGPVKPVTQLAQRDFLTGPAVWEIERVASADGSKSLLLMSQL
jgi:hypothetical protein